MTANDAIRGALEVLGLVAPNQPVAAEDANTGLEWLRRMLAGWSSAPGLAPLSLRQERLPLTGAQSYAIGPGATWDAPTPVRILSASVRDGDLDAPLCLADVDTWDRLGGKTASGTAEYLRYEPGYAAGLVFVWPTGGESVLLSYQAEFQPPSALSDPIALPARYDQSVVFSLAEILGPSFERAVAPHIVARAEDGRRRLAAANAKRLQLRTDGVSRYEQNYFISAE